MTQVALAAPHRLAVQAGADAVADGGNALDAALAAAAALTVVYPHQCSLGGDLSALVRTPDGSVHVVLSLGAAPIAIDVHAIRAGGEGMPRQGPLTVTVPGVVAGWTALGDLGARLGLARPLKAAADLAATGVPVSPGLSRAISSRFDAVQADPGLSGVFSRDGQPLTGTLKQPALASTLADLAEDPQDFYRGKVAGRLLHGLRDLGSPLSAADFANHRAEQPAPLTVETDHGTWWGAPPPAQGAIALALIRDWNHTDGLGLARRAHAARLQLLGDPAGGEIDLDGLLHPSRELTASTLSAGRAAGDTVAVTAIDRDGTAVALIQSVYQTFGAGLLEPATGLVMHNRGSAFVVLEDPQEHARHPARLQPGLRPPHTLCPLIGESATDRVTVALGCQGGRAQPLILAQVAADLIDPEQPLEPTLARPRWVVGDRDLGFEVETILTESPEVTPGSSQLPVVIAEDGGDDRCGHVQVARLTDTGPESGADPRADGSAILTG